MPFRASLSDLHFMKLWPLHHGASAVLASSHFPVVVNCGINRQWRGSLGDRDKATSADVASLLSSLPLCLPLTLPKREGTYSEEFPCGENSWERIGRYCSVQSVYTGVLRDSEEMQSLKKLLI